MFEGGSPFKVYQKAIVPVIILLHLALTLTLAYKLNIWMDEAFSLHTTEKGLSYALSQALNFELQAPFYFALLSLWRKIDSSIFFARLLSIAFVVLSIKTVATLSRRFWKDVHPGWLVAVVAFNPLTIAVAVDVRLYALVLLLSSLLLLTFYDGFLSESPKRRSQVFYVLLSIITLYTQYYTGFLLVANACALLILRRWRPLVEYLIGMAIVGLCFAPMLPFIRYQMTAHTAPMRNLQSWFELLKFITWRIKEYLLPAVWDPLLAARSWVLRGCYVAAILILIKGRHRLRPETIAIWTTTIVISFFLLITARISGELLIQVRHTIVLFLPATFAAFGLILLAANKRVIQAWVLLVLVFCSITLFVRYKPMAKDGDWQRVAAYLMAKEKPQQAILVFHGGAALPLSRYYAGRNMLLPLPRDNAFERFDFHDYVLRDEREIVAALERAPGQHEQLWLIMDGDCGFADISYNCEILEEFAGKYYAVEETKYFHGSTVRLLRRKSDN